MITTHRAQPQLRRLFDVGLALVIPLSWSIAQPETFHQTWGWTSYTSSSGLPSNQVLCIGQSSSGTTWVGTSRGLAWFDGYVWHAVDSAAGTPLKPVLLIEPLGKDSVIVLIDTTLYVGTKERFARLLPEGSLRGPIQSAVVGSGKDIYILTNASLYLFHDNSLQRLPTPAQPMPSGSRNLWKTRSGSLWLNTIRGLFRGNGTSWTRLPSFPQLPCVVNDISEDRAGHGVATVDQPKEATGVWEWGRLGPASKSSTERSRFPQTMDSKPDGTVIVIYQSGDVRIRQGGSWSSPTAPPLPVASTHFVRYQANGDLWLGTDEGLFLIRSFADRWEYWQHPFADLRNYTHSICRSSDGSIWLGTLQGIEIHRPDGRVRYIEEILGTSLGTVTGIIEDRERNIWLCSGSSFGGAFRWNGRAWQHFGPHDGLTAPFVHKIRMDRRGRLWFLGLGLKYIDPQGQPGAFLYENGRFINWPEGDSTHPGLINGRVYAFAEGKDGAYWFGTFGGLNRWKDGHWTHWTRGSGLANVNSRVYALAIDSSGTVWFSNETSGLGRIEKSDSVRYFTTEDGLVNNVIWDLKVDESGILWISTIGGLSCYSNGFISNFTLRNGLNSLTVWDILPLKDKVYVGTRGAGVNVLSRREQLSPPLLQMSPPAVRGNTALLQWRAASYFGQMQPEDIAYRYCIDGEAWSTWAKQSELQLTNLAAGSHEVEIQGRGLLGVLSDPAKVSLVVDSPVYRRPEVLAPMALLAGAIAFMIGATWHRERNHKRQLVQSDERFRLIAGSTSDLIFDCNFQTETIWSNDPIRAFATVPTPRFDEVARAWLEVIHEDDRERIHKSLLAAIAQKSSEWHGEYRTRRMDGRRPHTLLRVQILYDEEGRPARVLGSAMDISERKEAEEITRNLSRRILEAQESERRRVSRELHDSVNQILASVKFRIESLEEQLPQRSIRVKREAQKTKKLLNKVMSEVRRISRNLRPAELDDLGLASAIRSLAEEFSERTKIDVVISSPSPVSNPSPEITVALYRIVQEALTNVEKHSDATRVTIGFSATEEELICSISDNGHGIPADEKARTKSRGLGIVDMRERLSLLKGTLELSSRGKRGATLTARIPIIQVTPSTTRE